MLMGWDMCWSRGYRYIVVRLIDEVEEYFANDVSGVAIPQWVLGVKVAS